MRGYEDEQWSGGLQRSRAEGDGARLDQGAVMGKAAPVQEPGSRSFYASYWVPAKQTRAKISFLQGSKAHVHPGIRAFGGKGIRFCSNSRSGAQPQLDCSRPHFAIFPFEPSSPSSGPTGLRRSLLLVCTSLRRRRQREENPQCIGTNCLFSLAQ